MGDIYSDRAAASDRTMKSWAYEERSANKRGDKKRATEAHRNMADSARQGYKDRRVARARKRN